MGERCAVIGNSHGGAMAIQLALAIPPERDAALSRASTMATLACCAWR